MWQRSSTWLGMLLLLGIIFCYGITQLLLIRFTKGDVYPPYSSLRADPLGTKALADSLELLPGVELRRHLLPFERLQPAPDRTLIFAGLQRYSLQAVPEPIVNQFRQLVANHSRAILAYYPYTTPTGAFGVMMDEARKESNKEKEREKKDEKKEMKEPPTEDPMLAKLQNVNMTVDMGVQVIEDTGELPKLATLQTDLDLPATLEWHSLLTFKIVDKKAWRVIYSINGAPVLIERDLGTGSIVLASDSYFLSNEALRVARHPRLLAWLIGDNPTVIFDESHLGVNQSPGVASLAREYGLQGAFFGLVLLAILFIWRSTATFQPRREDAASKGIVEVERDNTSGLVTILRHHIKPKELINHCVTEWELSVTSKRPDLQAKAQAVQQLKDSPESPVSTYQQIAALLNKRK